MRGPRRFVVLLVLGLLVMGSAGAEGGTAHAAADHLTRAEQTAAKAATSAFRAQVTHAAEQLSASLVTIDASLSQPDGSVDREALDRARAAFDVVRVQMVDPRAASTQGGTHLLSSALWSPSVLAMNHAALATAAPILTVVLDRVILSPQAIALSAQRSTAWISRTAPSVLAGSTSFTRGDLQATAVATSAAIGSLEMLGRLVAPAETAQVIRASDLLEAATSSPTATLRQVMAAADVLAVHLGSLGGDLSGYGKGALYQ